jgi:histidyl-tRNA synthetase
MLRGTRILVGDEAARYVATIDTLRSIMFDHQFTEIVVPSIWEQQTFIDKAGPAIVSQMWAFTDKADRPVCLIPEVTGLIQEMWRDDWSKNQPKPYRVFYVNRCYRYERPQAGRYREFTQFGVEILGGSAPEDREQATAILLDCLDHFVDWFGLEYTFHDAVQRGLSYYVDDGFEVECAKLGAQKQIAGGGRYAEGIGWAIGVDRLLLAIQSADRIEDRLPNQ